MAEYEKPKEKRKRLRQERVIVRDRKWVADYERKQGAALNLPGYRLPGTSERSNK